ncbi:MFS transporter [Paenibacillus caui]|uniref:MFS transporter n=1 Tax=Paenibacillus caui TaxID=2873927 RepID=UPI001F3E4777|nr:MFS transporter [Paenibacillus caui]
MFSPAKNGKIKEIVPREQLDQAVSYSAIIEQGSKIAGPALGGLLTAAFGINACFLLEWPDISAVRTFSVSCSRPDAG